MPTYLIERDIPGANRLSASELRTFPRSPTKSSPASAYPTNGSPAMWPATSSTACMRRRAPNRSPPCQRGRLSGEHVTEVAAVIGPSTARGT